MSPHRKPNSKYYKVQLKGLARYGNTPLLSTGSTSIITARQMEESLRRVHEMGLRDKKYFELLDALKPEGKGQRGKLTLPDLHYAVMHKEVEDLLLSLISPTLSDAVDDFLTFSRHDTKANRDGMGKLLRLAPEKVRGEETRVSYLQNHRNILDICRKLESEGLKRSTVERSFLSPLRVFLRHTFSKSERDRIFGEIEYKAEKAKPRPLMDAALITQFLSVCDKNAENTRSKIKKEMPTIARISLLTSGDLLPILRLTPADIQIVQDSYASIHLRASKNEKRNRTVIVSAVIIPHLLKAIEGKASHEKLFTATSGQISTAWADMRSRYSLPPFRFKDLRHAFAKHAALSGIDERNAQHAMGHSNQQMTKHYAALSAKLTTQDADALARSMGLFRTGTKLRKAK